MKSLEKIVEEVIKENPEQVKRIRNIIKVERAYSNYLTGQVMKITKGKADAKKAKEMILERMGL